MDNYKYLKVYFNETLVGTLTTTINGEGKNPTFDDILDVAKNIGIKNTFAKNIALEIKDKCKKLINQ